MLKTRALTQYQSYLKHTDISKSKSDTVWSFRGEFSLNHGDVLQPRRSLETINREYSSASAESTVNVKQVRDSKAVMM